MADPIAPVVPLAPATGPQQLPHDIRGLLPYHQSWLDRWPYLAAAFGALVLLVLLVWWLKRRAANKPPAPPPDPWDVLGARLANLVMPRPFGTLEQAEYFFQLSLLLREAIELRTGLRATDSTLAELKAPVRNRLPLPSTDVESVLGFLERADFVKFAGLPATVEEALEARERVAQWARRLRPPAVAVEGGPLDLRMTQQGGAR